MENSGCVNVSCLSSVISLDLPSHLEGRWGDWPGRSMVVRTEAQPGVCPHSAPPCHLGKRLIFTEFLYL